MSEKTIRVKKEENRLLVYYSPSINFDEIVRNIAYGTLIKGTFWVTQDNLVEVNEEEEYICFRIAGTEGTYYVLDKKVFNTVQELLKKNKNKANKNIELFSGFMFCKISYAIS